MWGKKKAAPQEAHVETDEEFWVKRDSERRDWEAKEKQADIDSGWDGYPSTAASLTTAELAELYSYELSAYNDTVGYYADGIERVCPLPRRK